MAVATSTALIIAGAAAAGGSAVAGGISAKKQADENSKIYQAQAAQIEQQKILTRKQFATRRQRMTGTIEARTGASGFEMSGNPLEVLNNNLEALEVDEKIAVSNLETEQQRAEDSSSFQKRAGRDAMTAGIMKGVSTALTPATGQYARYK